MDYAVHGILQARILEWVAFPFSRDLSNPGNKPRSPALQVDSLPTKLQEEPYWDLGLPICLFFLVLKQCHSLLTIIYDIKEVRLFLNIGHATIFSVFSFLKELLSFVELLMTPYYFTPL